MVIVILWVNQQYKIKQSFEITFVVMISQITYLWSAPYRKNKGFSQQDSINQLYWVTNNIEIDDQVCENLCLIFLPPEYSFKEIW